MSPKPECTARLLYASAADAARVLDALDQTAQRSDLTPALASALHAMAPQVDGTELAVDLLPIMASPDAIRDLTALLGVAASTAD
jgi:hypothetical protein